MVRAFNSPVTTGRLMFSEPANSSILLYKAIPLQILPVPEPGTAVLLIAGLAWIGRRPRASVRGQ